MAAGDEETWTLEVQGLSRNVNETHLREIFGTFGEVATASVSFDTRTGLSKGFGHVEYGARSSAEAAQVYLDGAQIDGQCVKTSFILIKPRQRSRSRSRSRSRERGRERDRSFSRDRGNGRGSGRRR